MKSLVLALVFLAGFATNVCAGFDWNGFASGMSVEAARSQLARMGLSVTNDDKTDRGIALVAVRPPMPGTGLTVLNFCGDRLYLAQFNLQPSFANFVRTVEKYRSGYGQPADVHPESDVLAAGESHSLSIWWRQPYGWFTIQYNQFSSNDQLYLMLEDTGICG